MPILVPCPGSDIRAIVQCDKVIFPPYAKRDGVFFKLSTVSVGVQLLGECNKTVSNLAQTTLQHGLDGVHVEVRQ